MDEKVVQGKYGPRRYQFAIVCRIHGVHAQPQETFHDPDRALSYVDGLSVTDCGEDTVMVAVDPGLSERECAARPEAMRALLERDRGRGRVDPPRSRASIRARVTFGDLEEVTRALIARVRETRGEMYALLDGASEAFDAGDYDLCRAKLAELHYLARLRAEATGG